MKKLVIFFILLTLAFCLSVPASAAGTAFTLESDGWHAPAKPAAAVLDYSIDWSQWLAADTIAGSAWTGDAGITITPASLGAPYTRTTTWLSGGTAGQAYKITNTITTAAGRTQVQTFKVWVY